MYVSMFAIWLQWKLSFKISINQLKVDNASFVYRYSRAVHKITNYSLGQVRQIIKRLKLQFYQGMKTHRHIFTEVSVWEFHRKAREILEKAAQAWVR